MMIPNMGTKFSNSEIFDFFLNCVCIVVFNGRVDKSFDIIGVLMKRDVRE